MVPPPPAVALPEIPTLAPSPMLAGEQFSALIHAGPGLPGLRDFADTWRSHAASIPRLELANENRIGFRCDRSYSWLADSDTRNSLEVL
jgi:hypothetical protein